MRTKILIGLIIIVLISGCVPDKGEVKVLKGVEFQIQNAEYEAEKIIITLSTNVSVETTTLSTLTIKSTT